MKKNQKIVKKFTQRKSSLTFHILTLFPETVKCVYRESIIKKAVENGLIKIHLYDLRKWGLGKRKTVDDEAYGGGAGMVLKVDVIDRALQDIKKKIRPTNSKIVFKKVQTILLTPQGKPYQQKDAEKLSEEENIILICGHYEGFDERIREKLVDKEISVGDYVLTGGEIPAMIIVDSVSRLIPGVLGKEESIKEETFNNGLLEYPQFTRPREYKEWNVPDILLSGNHKNIEGWRKKESIKRTRKKRPDLLK